MIEGCLLIADISGYTSYLNKSELDHAEKTLTAILELLVDQTQPPLVISRLEGDAVISYGLRDHLYSGQTLVEKIENTYVAFRKAIERMVLNTTCNCNACANISNLDLKFFIHYGQFALQHIRGQQDLVGTDVNLIHRLVKNKVQEAFGYRAYILYTEAAIQQLGLEEFTSRMEPHMESCEDIGDVKVWIQNLHPVWNNKKNTSQITIPADQIFSTYELEINIPPEVLWDYLNSPEYRNTLLGSDRTEVTNRSHGRITPGSVFHCYHGDDIIPQTVLEWQPFKRILIQQLLPVPFPNMTTMNEINLTPSNNGTRLTFIDSKPQGPFLGRIIVSIMMKRMEKEYIGYTLEFKKQVEEDFQMNKENLSMFVASG
jgi:uncharacterized protein YndB with AHSA1/START domain